MDSKLLIMKIAVVAYAILILGLSIMGHIGAVIGITVAAYGVLGYRKFKKYKQKQLVTGAQS